MEKIMWVKQVMWNYFTKGFLLELWEGRPCEEGMSF